MFLEAVLQRLAAALRGYMSFVCAQAMLTSCYLAASSTPAVYVSPAIVSAAEASVDETLRNNSWLDVSTVLPLALSSADVVQLLDRCAGLAKDRGQVAGSFIDASS